MHGCVFAGYKWNSLKGKHTAAQYIVMAVVVAYCIVEIELISLSFSPQSPGATTCNCNLTLYIASITFRGQYSRRNTVKWLAERE
jgi:hypothetical protein